MRLQLLLLPLALASPAIAQFSASRPLIAQSDSAPVQGIPHDAMWTSQFFIGEGSAFITPVDGGYLDTVTHHHVRWDAGVRQYRGLDGHHWRIQPLCAQRLLMERDLTPGERTWVRVVEWDGREMHLFNIETKEDSAFARHMRRQGIALHDGEVSGSPSTIREALQTLPLPAPTLD